MILGIFMVLSGLGLSVLGLDQADKRDGALGTIISLLAPIGVALAVTGALIIFVPTFFDPVPNGAVMP